jgi:hypothetical protein
MIILVCSLLMNYPMLIHLQISRTATLGNERRPGELLFCKLNSFGPTETKLYTFEKSTVWTSEWCVEAPEYVCIGKGEMYESDPTRCFPFKQSSDQSSPTLKGLTGKACLLNLNGGKRFLNSDESDVLACAFPAQVNDFKISDMERSWPCGENREREGDRSVMTLLYSNN